MDHGTQKGREVTAMRGHGRPGLHSYLPPLVTYLKLSFSIREMGELLLSWGFW